MKRFSISSVFGVFYLVLLISLPAYAEQRLALVIGNDNYQKFGALKNARADARAIASKFKSLGFDVTLQLDADAKTTLRVVRQFKSRIKGGDVAVFYFSGHGVQLEAANYLLPVDIAAESIDQVKDDALALQRVLDDFREQKARFSLAILDACRDNPFKGLGRALGGRGLAPVTAANGQMVLYSAGAGQQALDQLGTNDPNPNGLFTRILLKEIDQPGVSIDRVLRKVRDEVVQQALSVGHDQVPALYDQTIGDFYFNSSVVPVPAVATLARPPAPAQQASKIFRDCKDCPEMVMIPAGTFKMGAPSYDPEGHPSQRPQHLVQVPAFALAKTELTRGQFSAFIKATKYVPDSLCSRIVFSAESKTDKGVKIPGGSWQSPGFLQEDDHPVVCISRDDANAYLDWLSNLSGQQYRLPSEAEWEYAARAGSNTSRFWGEDSNQACKYANIRDRISERDAPGREGGAHDCEDGYVYTAPVGRYKPNAFGLYDMIGNVSEWVDDCSNNTYEGAPSDGSAWKKGACHLGEVRGGAWDDSPIRARSAKRKSLLILYLGNEGLGGFRSENAVGFRPARGMP